MSFFKKEHKNLAKLSSSVLKKKYEESEDKLRAVAKTGNEKELKKVMKEHGNIEYAMLFQSTPEFKKKNKKEFPKNFPFWARLKIGKKRTTLVIDEDKAFNKKTKKFEDGFVDREATHTYKKDYEEIFPNPDPDDNQPMYLRRPTKRPKRLYEPHNKNLNMPKHLKERYDKNNYK